MSAPAEAAFAQLAAFLRGGRLTGLVADLEQQLSDADASQAASAGAAAGMAPDLLAAAMLVRRDIGRINDLIHAAAITLTLPDILEPGERLVNRPSLAAGNSPAQHYDVETDRRVAEFKLAGWSGTDAMRKRGIFHDLVHLAADTSGRRPELYVVGPAPIRFLTGSRSTARWALNRGADSTRELYLARFGDLDLPVREFAAGPAAHVRLIDLVNVLPAVGAVVDV
jgi:hypothetical protein